jgi:hypothetical protein
VYSRTFGDVFRQTEHRGQTAENEFVQPESQRQRGYIELLGKMAEDICFNNTEKYFAMSLD